MILERPAGRLYQNIYIRFMTLPFNAAEHSAVFVYREKGPTVTVFCGDQGQTECEY